MASSTAAIIPLFIFLFSLPSLLQSQQPYEGLSISDCGNQHNSTTLLGYFCNGYSNSCQSFLTFHSQPPYDSLEAISSFLSSDISQLSQLNSNFTTNSKVVVPVTCSCSNGYYQANTSYVVKHQETYFTIGNNTFQGLSSCQAIEKQNHNLSDNGLFSGMKITVPLRCACPTTQQRSKGVKYLLSYLVEEGDTVFMIGQNFGVDFNSILHANNLSESNADIYPFTTLLIPLKNQPNGSQIAKPSSPPVRSTPASFSNGKKSSNHTALYVGISFAILSCILILSFIVFFYIRLKSKNRRKINQEKTSFSDNSSISDKLASNSMDFGNPESFLSSMSGVGQSLKVYKFEELQLATENFKYRIDGAVFRGVFDGGFAAVKMMNRDVSKEIEILNKISHFNLISLSGLCFGYGHGYFIYEYAQNGSLSNWIFSPSGTTLLSWNTRLQIVLDIANGLNYLHSYTEPPYVHNDIKSSNILLDANFRGKISNFGRARRAQGRQGEHELTKHIVGTKGYMAPEYLEHGLISPKLDVYAFGVLMLEILTGRDAISLQRGEDGCSIVDFVKIMTEEEDENAREKIGIFIDSSIIGEYSLDSAFFLASLIEGCLRKDASSRPSMKLIVQSLSKLFASFSISLSMSTSEN